MTRLFNHRERLMRLFSVKSSEKSTSIQKITGRCFFGSMKILCENSHAFYDVYLSVERQSAALQEEERL